MGNVVTEVVEGVGETAKSGGGGGCLLVIFLVFGIIGGVTKFVDNLTGNLSGYVAVITPLNEYKEIEKSPMGKEIGIIKTDSVLKVRSVFKRGKLTWIKAYKLNPDDTVANTFVCIPEKVNIEIENKYVLFNENSKSWNAYYERVDKRNQPIFEKYKKKFVEAVKSIEVKKGSDNITKESIKDSCWILDRKGYFDLYVAKGDVFYYIKKDSKSAFLNTYNKCHSKYETDKIQYFPK